MSFSRRHVVIIMAAVVLVPLAAAFVLLNMMSFGPDSSGTHRVTQVVGGPFSLVSTEGQAVSPATWPGKLLVIAFGYGFCPDICPTSLGTIAHALDRLGPDGARIQPLFITIDPERDSGDKLRNFVGQFHPRLIGLTGTPARIADAARAYKVYYNKVEGGTPGNYTIDHTAFFFAADDRGEVVKVFSHDITSDKLAAELSELLHR